MPRGAVAGPRPPPLLLPLLGLLPRAARGALAVQRRHGAGGASGSDFANFQWGPPSNEPIEMHLSFVTDCTSHQAWMATALLHSARRLGADHPHVAARALLRRQARAAGGEGAASAAGVPAAAPPRRQRQPRDARHQLDQAPGVPAAPRRHSSIGDDAVVAMLDADFLFMSKLRVDDLAENSLLSMGSRPAPGSRAVLGMQGVVQRYECRGFAGAPYIFTAKAWRALLPAYAGLRFEARPNDWGSEQNAWVIAAQLAGVRYMPFDHFMISDMRVHLPYPTEQHPPDPTHGHEGWPWVERFMATEGGDACAARVGHGDAPRRLPTFLHTVRPWNPEQQNTSWQFSKYQVPPGWSRQDGEGILDCDMPLLAEPARDYVRVVGETPLPHPNRTQVRAARRRRLEAWTMCGIIHGLNDMLMDVKKLKCPQGFNDRRALKIEGHWNNRLLEPYAPEGGDAESVRRCSVGLTCTRGIAPLGGDGQPAGQHSFAARGGQRAAAPLL
ncbi:unnamed protein product [Prorocentrum cordatum]|uniref:Hexosyltransferase n=1 Tax=Prorocentrum cordatum TaxID=2364126 RepID=A0ABN9VKE3_9DINO|nr:unnamed protein product [Polarella glacialis]